MKVRRIIVGEQADGRGTYRKRADCYHAYLKRAARRCLRRLGRQYLDDAPTKYYYRGYET